MSKPKVEREYFSDPSAWPDIRLVPFWHWSHETDECFDISSSDALYDTMQAAFRGALNHLRNECDHNA